MQEGAEPADTQQPDGAGRYGQFGAWRRRDESTYPPAASLPGRATAPTNDHGRIYYFAVCAGSVCV